MCVRRQVAWLALYPRSRDVAANGQTGRSLPLPVSVRKSEGAPFNPWSGGWRMGWWEVLPCQV